MLGPTLWKSDSVRTLSAVMLAERNPAERGQLVEWRVTRSCTPEERWSAPYARRSTPPTSAPILVDAQASKAKVIVFAVAGADLLNALKQASEVHLASAQYLATPITYLSDVNAAGLDVAHDLTFMQSWYWDLNDQTRAFGKRFFARRQRMPNDNQVALYSSVRHYLEAVARAGTDDTQTVMKGDEGRADP